MGCPGGSLPCAPHGPGRAGHHARPGAFAPQEAEARLHASRALPSASSALAQPWHDLQAKCLLSGRELSQWLWDNRTVSAAGAASLVSTAVSFPLDSLKARLQVRSYPSPAVWTCARDVFRHEGLGGFLRGMSAPLITITFVRTSSISIYTYTKNRLRQAGYARNRNDLRHVALAGALGGLASGVVVSCGSAPFELVKVERQLEYLISLQHSHIVRAKSPLAPPHPSPAKYVPMTGWAAAWQIYNNFGVGGFYLGFRLSLVRDAVGTTLYFAFYDTCRALVARQSAAQRQSAAPTDAAVGVWGIPAPMITFLTGSAAGIASWLFVYPLDLVKTRVQKQALAGGQPAPALQTFIDIVNAPPKVAPETAARGDVHLGFVPRFLRLYRGLGISAFRSFISHGITWSLIEYFSALITHRAQCDGIAGSTWSSERTGVKQAYTLSDTSFPE